MENKITFLIISDIHAEKNFKTLPGNEAFKLLDLFILKAEDFFKPDFIVDLGDNINPLSESEDFNTLSTITGKFLNSNCPVFLFKVIMI